MFRWLNLALLVLIIFLSASLFTGRGGIPGLYELHGLINKQEQENAAVAKRVSSLTQKVEALKNDLGAVEEVAREEMGLIMPGEIFIRILDNPDADTRRQ